MTNPFRRLYPVPGIPGTFIALAKPAANVFPPPIQAGINLLPELMHRGNEHLTVTVYPVDRPYVPRLYGISIQSAYFGVVPDEHFALPIYHQFEKYRRGYWLWTNCIDPKMRACTLGNKRNALKFAREVLKMDFSVAQRIYKLKAFL